MTNIPPEAIASAVAVYAAAKGLGIDAALGDFLKKVLDEPAKDLGEILASFTTKRLKNFLSVGQRSKEMMAAAGAIAEPIPTRTLQPIVECAANEELPEMQELWAALLANAAIAGTEIPPLYPRILSSLSPAAAHVLNRIYLMTDATHCMSLEPPRRVGREGPRYRGFSQQQIESPHFIGTELGELDADIAVSLPDLIALGLVEPLPERQPNLGPNYDKTRVEYELDRKRPSEFRLSLVGVAFLRACRPPAQRVG